MHNPPHIIVLDIGLPEVDGLTLTKFFRSTSQAPIVIISARPTEEDRLMALELGADDYLVKPFSVRELVVRLKNIERRLISHIPMSSHGTRMPIVIGDIKINPTTLSFDSGHESVKCTKSEFELLYFLAKHQGEIVARDTLMREIMGYDNYLYDRTIDTHMKNLRKKVDKYVMIETVRGVGYVLKHIAV